MFRAADSHTQAVTKIEFLTGVFEKLVVEAGLRRERIEQLLAEIGEERCDPASPVDATKRAA